MLPLCLQVQAAPPLTTGLRVLGFRRFAAHELSPAPPKARRKQNEVQAALQLAAQYHCRAGIQHNLLVAACQLNCTLS